MQIKASQALTMIATLIRAKLVPLLTGSPGIGKSNIYQQIADQYKLLLIDVRLGQCDVTDINGFPMITGNKAGYVPMDTFPIEGDPLPVGYTGWLLLFDELTSAVPALQAASYKILLDRMVGLHKLHKNVAVCAAGNLETDNAVVESMSTALQSRLIHLELVVDSLEWINWANTQDFDHRITSFISFQPNKLQTFKPDHSDKTYACPRTWEFANRILKLVDAKDKDAVALLSGTLTEGVAREFLLFCDIYTNLPTIADILAAPGQIRVSDEPSILFALTGSIAHHATLVNIAPLMEYVSRLPVEFQIVCLRQTIQRNKELLGAPALQKWLASSAVNLF